MQISLFTCFMILYERKDGTRFKTINQSFRIENGNLLQSHLNLQFKHYKIRLFMRLALSLLAQYDHIGNDFLISSHEYFSQTTN